VTADKLNAEAREYFRKQGARGGKIGAKARMKKLSPAQRSAIAKNAVTVREQKRAQQNGTTPAALPKAVKPAAARRTKNV
jgi:hypothetical protein